MRRLAALFLGGAILVSPVLAASPALAVTGCADLTFLTAPQAEGLGLTPNQCVPQAPGQSDSDAVADWLATPGDLNEWLVVPGSGVTKLNPAFAGTVTTSLGSVVAGASATGTALAGAAMAGVSLAVGGLLSWAWQPDATTLSTVPVPPVVGTPGSFNNFSMTWPTTYTSTTTVLTGSYGNTTDPLSLTYARPTTTVFAKGYDYYYWCASTPATLVSLGGHYGTSASAISVTHTKAASLCSSAGGWGGFQFVPYAPAGATINATVVATSLPTDPFPGRTIEQTVTCRRADGSSYSVTNSTDASAGLSLAASIAVAGLNCDAGSRAESVGATLVTPGEPDVTIVNPVTVPTKVPNLVTVPSCATTAVGCVVTNPTPVPSPTPVLTDPPPGFDPGTPGEDLTTPTETFCNIAFGDLLTGLVVFKAVGCALSWAFVPSPGVASAQVDALRSAWSGSRVGTFTSAGAGSISAVAGLFSVGSACGGVPVTIPLSGTDYETVLLDSCSGSVKTMADTTHLLLTVVVAVGGVLLLINTALGAFGLPRMWSRSDGD